MENNFNINSASISDRGLSEKRPENEDSFLVLEERGVYAVADGVGGAQAGDVASQMAMEILGEAFVHQVADLDAEDLMRAAIERANSAIYQMASDLPQLSSMATTIVALHVYGNIATIGHVGDSRAYRLDHNGVLRRETDDHSVVEEEVRAGRMTAEQAANHPSKNVISRALGAEPDVEIDLRTIMVEPGTTFLLCSDGITRHIDDNEIGGFLGAAADPAEICRQMKEICYDRGAEDNLTAVIVRVESNSVQQSFAAAAASSEIDIEETTIASARSPFDSVVKESDDDFANGDTIAIDDLTELDDQSYLIEEEARTGDESGRSDLQNYSSSTVVVPAQQPASIAPTPVLRSYTETLAEEKSPTGASRFLSGLLFLLLGAVLGAAGYYFWVGAQPERVIEVPVMPEAKSNNVPLTAFEEGRRLVDKDPTAYLNAKAASPRDASDYFLLGRAALLSGKYWEAKKLFTDARNRLATADSSDAKTLANEISMALAIIESPQATETFTRDVAAANSAGNSNTNATVPSQPVR